LPDLILGRGKDAMDQRYSSVIHNLSTYNDDAIFFSMLIGDDLRRYANELKATLPSWFRSKAPVITSADFSKAAELLPDPTKYTDFETMFVSIKGSESLNFWKAQQPHDAA
jgi:hypothetical protein